MNYIKTGWRNISRNKVHSLISISGLAVALACVLLIFRYISDELSYDRFFKDANRIYRVNLAGKMGDDEFLSAQTPPPVGKTMMDNFPEIEAYTRIYKPGDEVISSSRATGKRFFNEKQLLSVDSNFLQVFDFAVKDGNSTTCLLAPDAVVLTESSAKKYFGGDSPIGKTLQFDEWSNPFTVTAVLKDLPPQSSIQFSMLISNAGMPPVKRFDWSWVWLQMTTYIKLKETVPSNTEVIRKMESKFPQMVKQFAAGAFERIGKPFNEFKAQGGKWDFSLQPLAEVHLGSQGIFSKLVEHSDRKYIYIFSVTALFIVLLACVNFMNLSTARSVKRSKEVGVRKVLGSGRGQLIRQFLTEALICSFSAMAAALALVALLMPAFNSISGKSLQFRSLLTVETGGSVLLITLITALLSGIYPAFYLSSFRPVQVFKSQGTSGRKPGGQFIRNGLVIFQFTVSAALIICTIMVYKQLQYTRQHDLGLNKDNVLILPDAEKMGSSTESFTEEVRQLPGIMYAARSSSIPAHNPFGDFYVPQREGGAELNVKDITLSSFMTDNEFIPALGIRLLSGRAFSKEFNDSASVILNETAVKQIGWKNPLGKFIEYPGNGNQRFKVIGVAKDFNVESLHNPITPFALFHYSSESFHTNSTYISVRIKGGEMKKTLSLLESKWHSFAPDIPFEYSFLDDELNALYRADQRIGKVFNIFTVLSLFIACMGVFALVAFTAEQRTKEIGIRKVLGATVANITGMLCREFIRLVLIAIVVACPIAWWGIHKWLEGFAYKTDISYWVFIFTGLLTVIIALSTISFHAIKAALANPVKSLRTE